MAKIYASGISAIILSPNFLSFQISVVTIPVAGTPVQLPSIVIPDGVDVIVRAKVSNNKKIIYLSDSSANCLDPTKRLELAAGESIGLSLTNPNLIWIDSNQNGMKVEVLTEI